ncbi:MAG: carbohydrate ABC transporter permease, partial [Rhodospirillaceae bacterium]|nr:carbohydrate ABC transporter permease [Rhodospirillaceae bacterium]
MVDAPTADPRDAVSAVYLLLWAYIIGSLGLLFAVQRLRIYPLYLVKTAWITLTILAFAWVVMMSLTTNQEFANRPAGVFGVIGRFPVAFGQTGVWTQIWWIPLIAWVPLWAAGGMAEPGTPRRRRLRGALAIVSAIIVLPMTKLVLGYEHWSAYDNMVDNYRVAWSVARMGQYFFNSLLISLCAVGLVMALGSMMAYGLTRLRFRGRGWIMGILIASMGIPGFLLVVPLFVMMKDWSLGSFNFMDSRTGLAVLYGALAIP